MSIGPSAVGLHQVGLDDLKKHWGLFLVLGLLLIVLGTVALGSTVAATIITIKVIGFMMIAGGAIEAIHAFSCKRWGGFFIDLISGFLYVIVGFMLVRHPVDGGVVLTSLIAAYLVVSGVFRAVIAISSRYQHWAWLLLSGGVNVLLGVLIWQQWPYSGLWVIGMFVGIDMIFNGWSLVMLSLAAKNLPAPA